MELRVFQIASESGRRKMNLQISGNVFIFSEESLVFELNGVGILRLIRAEE